MSWLLPDKTAVTTRTEPETQQPQPMIYPQTQPQTQPSTQEQTLPPVIPVEERKPTPRTVIAVNDVEKKSIPWGEKVNNHTINQGHHNGYSEIASTDDEINSYGDRSEAPFDIRSDSTPGSTRDDNTPITTRVSTPYEERDGAYYCRNNKDKNTNKQNINKQDTDKQNTSKQNNIEAEINHSSVIDVCSYSDTTIFLLTDRNVTCEIFNDSIKKRYRAHNNTELLRIVSYDGYLYGVGADRKLYTLPNNHLTDTNWIWDIVKWAPADVIHVSSTHDASHLWIQTYTHGYLYGDNGGMISKIPYTGLRRVYGRDIGHYIDIDYNKHNAMVHPTNIVIRNVIDAALSYYDEVVAIYVADSDKYRAITIVNWKPYYIRV